MLCGYGRAGGLHRLHHSDRSRARCYATPSQWTTAQLPGGSLPTQTWFQDFGSAELDALIANAYSNSLDLQAADARLRQADARARAAGAAILPQVDLDANSTTYAGHSSNGSAHETDYGALISASYEIDFWGKNRSARDSAEAARKASEADRAVVALSAVTGVADTYFQVVALRERLELAQQALDNTQRVLDVVQARRSEGLGNPTDEAQQRAAVANAEIHIKDLQQQQDAELAALAILVGKMPGTLQIQAQHLSELHAPAVSAGLPAELLARRPDVFAAEESCRRRMRIWRRREPHFFLPSCSPEAADVQNPAVNAAVISLAGFGPSLTAGAALTQAIFNGGRLRAARDEAAARGAGDAGPVSRRDARGPVGRGDGARRDRASRAATGSTTGELWRRASWPSRARKLATAPARAISSRCWMPSARCLPRGSR